MTLSQHASFLSGVGCQDPGWGRAKLQRPKKKEMGDCTETGRPGIHDGGVACGISFGAEPTLKLLLYTDMQPFLTDSMRSKQSFHLPFSTKSPHSAPTKSPVGTARKNKK